MSVIPILIVASLVIAMGFLLAFIWSVRNGQFEDDKTPAMRMLFEDQTTETNSDPTIKTKS